MHEVIVLCGSFFVFVIFCVFFNVISQEMLRRDRNFHLVAELVAHYDEIPRDSITKETVISKMDRVSPQLGVLTGKDIPAGREMTVGEVVDILCV